MKELAGNLAHWIREQVSAAGCRGAVFGLSGGLDSAVVGALCRRAFPDDCLGVIMPCHSSREDIDHADLVARTFEIPTVSASLENAFNSLVEQVSHNDFDPGTRKLAEANLKPRLRMAILYYHANRLRYLVVGTGNRSEIAVGYSTKYGDGGVDILPLGNLLKQEVRDLARHLGIPPAIIDKPPSAGLWEGQTDESEMGITYEELDSCLSGGPASPEVRDRVEALHRASAHKRALPPVPPF